MKIVDRPKPWRKRLQWLKKVDWDSYCAVDSDKNDQQEILKYKPKLFCLNSATDCSKEDKQIVKQFMEKLFPNPSKFEL